MLQAAFATTDRNAADKGLHLINLLQQLIHRILAGFGRGAGGAGLGAGIAAGANSAVPDDFMFRNTERGGRAMADAIAAMIAKI